MKLKLYLNWVHLLTKFGPNLAIACPELAATRKQNQFKLFLNWVHFLMKFGTNLCEESLEKEFGSEIWEGVSGLGF